MKDNISELDVFQRHGSIQFDELKLSENLKVNSDGYVQGYVDYGSFSCGGKENKLCDHGLVILFQPFVGDWIQIIGVFATQNNMDGIMLAKVLLEAIILTEQSGLFVDTITGDGASWNRSMWKEFGIGVTKEGEIKCEVVHPCDEKRKLRFISDFPHLIKCLWNTFLQYGEFRTPYGKVVLEQLKAAWKEDENPLTLRVMPKICKVHFFPNNFEKMRVNLTFQLFGEEMIKGLLFYEEKVQQFGDSTETVNFIKRINRLMKIMTVNYPNKALRPNS